MSIFLGITLYHDTSKQIPKQAHPQCLVAQLSPHQLLKHLVHHINSVPFDSKSHAFLLCCADGR